MDRQQNKYIHLYKEEFELQKKQKKNWQTIHFPTCNTRPATNGQNTKTIFSEYSSPKRWIPISKSQNSARKRTSHMSTTSAAA